ncbi:MAG: putative surface protein with fasciclin (FAS1) repeats [Planctomycetota bacterium]|jgi:uncharacterized surface protein with fasciclin (FAS1) repeats
MITPSLSALLLLLGTTSSLEPQTPSSTPKNIVEIAQASGSFETLVAALAAANLLDTLAGDGPFTVFAPTDDAFAKLDDGVVESLLKPENIDRLSQILSFHVVSGNQSSTAALGLGKIPSLEGTELELRLDQGRLKVNDSLVINNDIPASNGTIHVIDSVLIPAAEESVPADPAAATAGILELAISRGVPLYNAGQTLACAAIYEVAVRSIVDRPLGVSEHALAPLRASLRASTKMSNAPDMAWELRAGIDRALSVLVPSSNTENEALQAAFSAPVERLFDFADPENVSGWFSVNDNVMGGISEGRMVALATGTARFEGALSLKNNGGFATVRSEARNLALGQADGLRARLMGDGRTYRVSALTGPGRLNSFTWQAEFTTVAGEWQEVVIPFADLDPTIMGRSLPKLKALDPRTIQSLSFGIADKDESPFKLEIEWIDSYRTATRKAT